MEVLVGLGIVAFFIVLGLNRSQKKDEKNGYCKL